jgi:hypothetical protein
MRPHDAEMIDVKRSVVLTRRQSDACDAAIRKTGSRGFSDLFRKLVALYLPDFVGREGGEACVALLVDGDEAKRLLAVSRALGLAPQKVLQQALLDRLPEYEEKAAELVKVRDKLLGIKAK